MSTPCFSFLRCAALLALAGGAACQSNAHGGEAAPEARPPSARLENDGIRLQEASMAHIQIETVEMGQGEVTIRAPARVAFRDQAVSRVGAPVAARVMKIHVKVGDKVSVKDPLATLASPDASGFHAELARGKVELSAAEDALRRQTEMVAKGVGREYERVVAEMRVRDAKERVLAAKRNVGLLGKSFGGTVVVMSQIEGIVLRRGASIGAQVDPDGEPLFEIGNPNDLWVVADVFQDDLHLIEEGAPVTVEIASRSEPLDGEVESIGVLLDAAVRRAPVYINLRQSHLALVKAGMFARAHIRSSTSNSVTLPVDAVLIKNGDQTIAYVERDDGTFIAREVQLGHTFDKRVEIVSGVREGDRVVVKGALLIDGAANQLL